MVESASKFSLLRTEYAHERVLWPNSSTSSGYVHLYRVMLILLVQDLGATLRQLLLYHSAQAFVGNFVQPLSSGIRQTKKVTMACIIHTHTMPGEKQKLIHSYDIECLQIQSTICSDIQHRFHHLVKLRQIQDAKIKNDQSISSHTTLPPCHQSILPPLQSL